MPRPLILLVPLPLRAMALLPVVWAPKLYSEPLTLMPAVLKATVCPVTIRSVVVMLPGPTMLRLVPKSGWLPAASMAISAAESARS